MIRVTGSRSRFAHAAHTLDGATLCGMKPWPERTWEEPAEGNGPQLCMDCLKKMGVVK